MARSLETSASDWTACLAMRDTLDKKPGDLRKLLTAIGYHAIHVRKLYTYGSWMDQYIAFRLGRGGTVQELAKNARRELIAFLAWISSSAADLKKALEADVARNAEEFEKSLPKEWPVDLRDRIRTPIRQALNYEEVAEHSKEIQGPSLDMQFREALKRASKP